MPCVAKPHHDTSCSCNVRLIPIENSEGPQGCGCVLPSHEFVRVEVYAYMDVLAQQWKCMQQEPVEASVSEMYQVRKEHIAGVRCCVTEPLSSACCVKRLQVSSIWYYKRKSCTIAIEELLMGLLSWAYGSTISE